MTDAHDQPPADAAGSGDAHRLEYAGAVGIADIGPLHEALQAALANPGPTVLDAEQVTQVDTAVVQLWSAFVRDAQAQGSSVSWHDPSGIVRSAATKLGLAPALGLAGEDAPGAGAGG